MKKHDMDLQKKVVENIFIIKKLNKKQGMEIKIFLIIFKTL
jgi:hypothetical protein